MVIQINDGKKTYEIQNQDGIVLGCVVFDPTDTNTLRKKDEFLREIETLVNELKNIDKEDISLVFHLEKEIKEKVNKFFGADVVSPFESIRGLFSPNGNGGYFVETVLKHLFNIVNEEYKTQSATASNRMKEYLDEYTEGEPK